MINTEQRFQQALTALKQGQIETAEELLHQCLTEAPQEREKWYLHLSRCAKENKAFAKAIGYLQKAIDANPHCPDYYNGLGLLYYQTKDFAKALKCYAKALQLKPDMVETHFNLALLFMKQQQLTEAITELKNVIVLAPDHTFSHKLLGDCYLQQQQFEAANTNYQWVLQRQPNQPDVLSNLGVMALKQKQLEKAAQYFTQALAVDENHFEARNNLAALYLQEDRYQNAMHHYQRLLSLKPDFLEGHYNMAVAAMAMGELVLAEAHFQWVLLRQAGNLDALINLAAVYLKKGLIDKAKAAYERALNLEPKHPIAAFMIHALQQDRTTIEAPAEYVRNLFDNYAGFYDKHMTEVLRYQGPLLIRKAIDELKEKPSLPWDILDCGCGTGLSGVVFNDLAKKCVGVDLSKKMLKYAALKQCYQELIEGDINHCLQAIATQFDLILAVDVFVYCGDLTKVFSAIQSLCRPQGLFAFTVEALTAFDETAIKKCPDYRLQTSARFCHSEHYLKKLIETSEFEMIKQEVIVPRYQDNQPVNGWLFVCRKR